MGLFIRIGSDLIKERRARCDNCRAKIQNPLARFCSKCGASLLTRYELPPARISEQGGWKSVPVLVRLGIWIIVIPPLLGVLDVRCAQRRIQRSEHRARRARAEP